MIVIGSCRWGRYLFETPMTQSRAVRGFRAEGTVAVRITPQTRRYQYVL